VLTHAQTRSGRRPAKNSASLEEARWRSHLETRDAARGSAVAHHVPCRENHRLYSRQSQRHIARRRRAQGHERPRSSTPSRGGSSAARRPAHRQDHQAAHLNAAGSTLSKNQGGEKAKMAKVALTLGRWCSRGRLDVDVHGGDASSASASRTQTVLLIGMAAPVLAAQAPVHGRPPVLPARRGGSAPYFFSPPPSSHFSSSPSSLGSGTGESGKTPKAVRR
jgi:hypothetical protein